MGQLRDAFEWGISHEAPSYVQFAAALLIVLAFGLYVLCSTLLFTLHPAFGFGFAFAAPAYVIWLGWRNK